MGYFSKDLDMSEDRVRLVENQFGNFFCDLVREETGSDVVFINSGQYRFNDLFNRQNPILLEFIFKCFPFTDNNIVKLMS